MAEKIKSGKNQYKTLRAYLVYAYIFKKTEGDMFTTTQINEYLQLFGIECDHRSIVRDIEAINQACIMSRDELDSAEEANVLLADKNNQLIYQNYDWRNMYRANKHNYRSIDFAMIGFAISTTQFTRWHAMRLDTAELSRVCSTAISNKRKTA